MPPIPEIGEGRQSSGVFCVLLDKGNFQKLKEQVKANPQLVEEVFQQFYPGLIESGMKRYQAEQLFF